MNPHLLAYGAAATLCLLGLILSCLSLSGTWPVLGAAALLARVLPGFPGIGTLIVFAVVCVAVELFDALAASWGIARRGGSKTAGWAALGGGLLGMLFGGMLIPVPILGSMLGLLAGSFAGAFFAERSKMKKADRAAHVAMGAVFARLAVLFVKVGATLLLSGALLTGLLLSANP